MKGCYKTWVKTVFFSGWGILVLWNFFRSFSFVNLMEILLNGAMLLILLLFFTALGRRGFCSTNISFASFAEECCFSFGLGTAISIFLIIGLAALGLLYKLLIILLVLGLSLLVYREARDICIRGYRVFSAAFSYKRPFINIVFLLFIGFAALVTFLAAATPPYFYDALVYHLAVPQKYLLHHGFRYFPRHHFSNYSSNLSMLFIVAMSFSGGMLAKLISWSFAPMTALAVYAFVKSRWGSQMAMASATILFLVPGVLIAAILTTVDSGVMFYSFLSFSALLSWFKLRQKHWFVLSGIFCGLAVGTKYTAIVVTFLTMEILLIVHEYFVEKRSFFRGAQQVFLFAVFVLCCASPWFIKNLWYTGNPIYPYFNWIFGSHASQLIEYKHYMLHMNSFFGEFASSDKPWFDFILPSLKAPWTITMTVNGMTAGKTGVLFLLCLPGVFFLKKDRIFCYLLLIAGCSFWGWVFLLPRELRFVFPIFPPLSIITAYILWRMPVSSRGRLLIFGGLGLILLYHLAFLFGVTNVLRPFTYLLGNQSEEEFLLTHGVNYYPVIQYANLEIPENSKILFVAESRGYYCERDYELYTVITGIDDSQLLLRTLIIESQNVEEVIQKLKHRGFTHILINLSEMDRFMTQYLSRNSYFGFQTEKDQQIFRTLFSQQYLHPLIAKHRATLYEILYARNSIE